MRYILRLALLALTIAIMVPPLHAEARYGMTTWNASNNPVWITIYHAGRQIDWGHLGPKSQRTWESGNYAGMSIYTVRYEFMDKNGKKLCDTETGVHVPFPIDSKGRVTGFFVPEKGSRGCWLELGDKMPR
jgi:hypothetical protein